MTDAVPVTAGGSGGSRLRVLLGLAWPIVLARATQSVIGFCDALFVAPLGEAPLAATTTGALNTFAAIMLPMGTAFIVQSFVAQLRGRGELSTVPRYAWYGLVLSIIAGVVAALAIPFVHGLLSPFGYAKDVHDWMSTYMTIRLLSIGPAVGIEALGNWFGGMGKTRPAMVAGIVAMVVNVAGCAVIVLPHFGLPGYGVAGAAWSSVLGSWAGFAVILWAFLFQESEGATFARRRPEGLRVAEFVRMLRFGLPNGINWFLEFAAFALFINVVVGHLGTTKLAAFNVVMQLNSVAFMPAFGLATSGAILVGEAIGRKAHADVWPLVRLTMIVNGIWMGAVGLTYATTPRLLMGLFRPSDLPAELFVETGATMLFFGAFWQVFDAATMTFSEALRAAGDTAWPMAARLILAWLVFTPVSWAAVFLWGGDVQTVMLFLVGYVGVLAVLVAARFASGKWKQIDLVGSEPAVLP
jgi:MATE family multidrug resistance protein